MRIRKRRGLWSRGPSRREPNGARRPAAEVADTSPP